MHFFFLFILHLQYINRAFFQYYLCISDFFHLLDIIFLLVLYIIYSIFLHFYAFRAFSIFCIIVSFHIQHMMLQYMQEVAT